MVLPEQVPDEQWRAWADVALRGAMAYDATHMDDEPRHGAEQDAYMVEQQAAALRTVFPAMMARMSRESLTLLAEWYSHWLDSDNMPTKLPNALHTRTCVELSIANYTQGTRYRVMSGEFAVGDPVWWIDASGNTSRAGEVTAVHQDGTYDLVWIDGLGGVDGSPGKRLRRRDS